MDSFAAAVGNFEKHGAISLIDVFRSQEIQVGGEFHFALRVARRFVEINDLPIVKIRGVDREINTADNFLVGLGESEAAAARNVRARNYFNARDMSVST